ncbi:MAG: zinc ABC transporter substrate-binding protein [Candidatus Rokubacteria bacterium]|nr:zinc ABC transporter substrate-binding protein [Candidatus Rokubacteria bacterium]
MAHFTRRRFLKAAGASAAGVAALALGFPEAEGRALRVVTSSTDLVAIAQEIGQDRVQGLSFFLGYQEPELWVEEVFPSWMLRAARADLFIRIGLFADVWADVVIEGARNPKISPGGPGLVDASAGIAVLEVPQGLVDRSLGEIHIQGNPHYLLDPLNAKVVAANILRGLSRVSPGDAEFFRKNAGEFSRRIDQAMTRWDVAAQPLRGKKLAAYHKTWSYLARRFGLTVVGYCEPKPGIEPSPADIRQLAETMAREGARLIIHAPVYSPRIPLAVAREVELRTGQPVRVLMLPAHVGGAPEAKDYFGLFDYLLARLVEALRVP